jgi:two-component system CitB family sensor kinase
MGGVRRFFRGGSLARRLLVLQLGVVAVIAGTGAVLTVVTVRERTEEQARQRVLGVAETVAQSPEVVRALGAADPAARLQPLAEGIRRRTGVAFVVVMSPAGIRHSHPTPARIGGRFVGTIGPAQRGRPLTERYRGTLGPSVRAVVPVFGSGSEVVGLVAVGELQEKIAAQVEHQLPGLLALAAVALTLGAALSLLLAARVRRQSLGLEPREITTLYEHHDATLHAIREGVLVVDEDGVLQLANDEALRLLGLPDVAEGTPVPAALPEGTLRDRLQSGAETRDELHLVGDRILVVNQSTAHVGRRAVGVVATLRDRTELQELVRELDAVRSLADSLRSQAHESANQLHAIVGLVELGRYDEAIAFATEQVEHAQDLLLRLQERVEEPALVALLLGKAAAARERGIELDVNPETPFAVAGASPTELVTIVGNLVDNAMDALAGREGPQWIAVTLWAEGGEAVIEVRDSGPGLPRGHAEKVFEAGWSTMAAGQGERGLGLALVRQTARRAGGSVTAASDGGAVFTVRLPAAVRKAEPA